MTLATLVDRLSRLDHLTPRAIEEALGTALVVVTSSNRFVTVYRGEGVGPVARVDYKQTREGATTARRVLTLTLAEDARFGLADAIAAWGPAEPGPMQSRRRPEEAISLSFSSASRVRMSGRFGVRSKCLGALHLVEDS